MAKTDYFYCKVCGNINNVKTIVNDVIRHIQRCKGSLEESTVFDLRVILNELILNAIKHGNKDDSNKFIIISAKLQGKCFIRISVEDEGTGYDYKCMPDRSSEFDDICNIEETGRGMIIVKSLCEEIEFNKKGNSITVTKRL